MRSELAIRVASAAVMLAAGLAALLLNVHARWVLLTAVLTIGVWELSRLTARKLASPAHAWLPALAVFALCLPSFPGWTAPLLWNWYVSLAALSALTGAAFSRLQITVMAPWIALNAFFIAYLGLWGGKVFALLLPLGGWRGIAPFLFTLACIIAADTGAYFTGRALGRHKLAPSISAGKTREGALGGLVAAMLVAWGFSAGGWSGGLMAPAAVLLGAVLALASIAGDLFISGFKRWALAKDTSNIIPGHGGVMDRFDALIFAAPFAWLGFRLLG
jgi:phosphatidate cytidylyltransferase